MSNVRDMRIFAAEQIEVPDNFPGIIKNFVKEVVRSQPENVISFSREYFEELLKVRGTFEAPVRDKVEFNPKEFYLTHKQNVKDHYELHEVIGEGALSRVRRGTHKLSKVLRAIKVVRKEDLEFGERRKLLDEIELLKELDHPNIGQVVEMYEDKKKFYFVNEMMYGGTLYDRVTREQLSENRAAKIIRQLISAVTYLHSKGIVHGDIKPHNIHFRGVDDDMIKLIDFGTSRRINPDHHMHGVFGTVYYLAPEVIEGDYDEKCDVWSIGVILYILIAGGPPFDGANGKEVIQAILKGQFNLQGGIWDGVSNETKDLISRMLCRQEERITAQEAFLHPVFEQLRMHENHDEDEDQQRHTQEQVHRALANLRSFSSKNKVRQAVLGFLVQHFMNVSEVRELERVFQELDTSGDGTLGKDEILAGYQKFYGQEFNEQEAEQLIEMADASSGGAINYSEFILTSVDKQKFLTLTRLEAIFNELDVDGNQMLSLDEINHFLGQSPHMDKESLAKAFEAVDPHGVGEISFEQFKDLIQNLLA